MTISLGRVATETDRADTSVSVGWSSGGAAVSGTLIIAVAAACFDTSAPLSISGGSAWTELDAGDGAGTIPDQCKAWKHVCGGSEPTTYTITYDGSNTSGDNGVAFAMMEILGANSTPDDDQYGTATGTCPTATSTNANDTAVILTAEADNNTSNFTTPPSGYTSQAVATKTHSGIINKLIAAIATKTGIGTGSISPGSWTPNSAVTTQKIWTILLSPATPPTAARLLSLRRKESLP